MSKANDHLITIERLHEVLSYDPATGIFRWIVRKSKSAKIGKIAGSKTTQGYCYIQLDGTRFFAHRLAWLYVHGKWPSDEIDHINHDRFDNRLNNLRSASRAENRYHSLRHNNNKCGFKGVCWDKHICKWRSSIMKEGVLYHLGYFTTDKAAHSAYMKAAKRLFGKFANS